MGEEPLSGTFSIEEAQKRLAELLQRAAAGEEVIIEGDVLSAKLVAVAPEAPLASEWGKYKGMIRVPDAFFEPITEDELAIWYGGDI